MKLHAGTATVRFAFGDIQGQLPDRQRHNGLSAPLSRWTDGRRWPLGRLRIEPVCSIVHYDTEGAYDSTPRQGLPVRVGISLDLVFCAGLYAITMAFRPRGCIEGH